jgi:hypothetical protein
LEQNTKRVDKDFLKTKKGEEKKKAKQKKQSKQTKIKKINSKVQDSVVNCKKFRSGEQNKNRSLWQRHMEIGEFAPAKFVPFNNGSLSDFKK